MQPKHVGSRSAAQTARLEDLVARLGFTGLGFGSLALAAAIIALSSWGLLGWIEHPLYDAQLRTATIVPSTPSRVLLVSDSEGLLTPERFRSLARQLLDLGAAGIVVTDASEPSATAYRELLDDGVALVLGVRASIDSRGELAPTAEFSGIDEEHLAWSVAGRADSSGVDRCQLSSATIAGATRPTVEWSAYRRHIAGGHLDRGQSGTGTDPFRSLGDCVPVRFRGGAGAVPEVTAARALDEGLVAELVEGRWILLGPSGRDFLSGVRTPMTTGLARLSVLEFQGQVLDALLSDRQIRKLPSWAVALLIGFVVIGFAWTARRVDPIWFSWLLGGSLLFLLLASLASLRWLGLWLPTAATAVGLLGVYALTTRQRLLSGQQSVRTLLNSLLGRLRSRLLPNSFYLSEDPWPQVAALVDQTVPTTRQLFLELPERQTRAREIFAQNCSFSEIGEQRRDITRSPYREALAATLPVALERTFLAGVSAPAGVADDVQYLVPLRFGSDLLGFWALGTDQQTASQPDFVGLLSDFADQIGEILYHRRRIRQSGLGQGRAELSANSPTEEAYHSLQWVSILLERRLQRMERLLKGLGSEVAVYDLFGRVIDVTGSMLDRLGRDGIAPFDLTALELICKLGKLSEDEARERLRVVIHERHPVTLPAYLGGSETPTSVVILSAIQGARSVVAVDEPTPFGLLGVSLELVETSSLQALSEVRGRLSDRLGDQVVRDLSEISGALLVLRNDEGWKFRNEVLKLVDAKMAHMQSVVEECQSYLSAGFDETVEGRYPIDAKEHLERVLENSRLQIEERALRLELSIPDQLAHVLASPGTIERGFQTILNFLFEDATQGEPFAVQVEERDSEMHFRFSNRGAGFMQAKLEEILGGAASAERPIDRELANFRETVEFWGGSLAGKSQIGIGTQLEVSLHRLQHL